MNGQTQRQVLLLFPEQLRERWEKAVAAAFSREEGLREIRLRAERPVLMLTGRGESFVKRDGGLTEQAERAYVLTAQELSRIVRHLCRYSLYAYEEELGQGFLSVSGGFRVGVTGEAVLGPDGMVKNIRHISSLNIRIAHQARGAGTEVLPFLYEGKTLCSTLLISPPGCGKTTLLRDLIRLVSDGSGKWPGKTVGVVDERSELAACVQGIPAHDLGLRTDVLDGCPKGPGMLMLLRSMGPEVIAADELGGPGDVVALEQVLKCGCSVLATVHGSGFEEIRKKRFLEPLFLAGAFGRYLVLGRREGRFWVEQVIDAGGSCLAAGIPC
ncbi:MAG: stage III sporulation protein AA [Eubacteriales bacterium]|nr:stage III sporulation protein AA [Eubacteriales bacterium]